MPSPIRPTAATPLAGVKILDLTRLIPGALAARKLADLGAEVVKIEQPGRGDYQRNIPPFADGAGILHRVLNRGKKSVTLDYRTPEGQAVLEKLVAQADAVVEVSRPGRLAEFGVDLAEMRRKHPKLVVCSVTAFGQDGPLARLPSHGMTVDALAGWVTLSKEDDGRTRISEANFTSVAIEFCGINAALGVVAALMQARATGEGAWIDASCWDAGVEALRYRLASKLAVGEDWVNPRRLGPMYDVYTAADGEPFLFCCSEKKFFEQFCDRVGRPELKDHWDGETEGDIDDDPELQAALDDIFAQRPAAEWGRLFLEWEVAGCQILHPFDVLEHPHFAARDMLDEARPGDSVVPLLDPLRWMEDGWRPGAGMLASPGLGEHTEEVLKSWLGEDGASAPS